MLRLEFECTFEDDDLLATLCIISTGQNYKWQARADKKVVSQFLMRAEIDVVIIILRETRNGANADRMLEIII